IATVLAVFAVLFVGVAGVTAQGATPAAAKFPNTMGLPELNVQVTDAAFEGLPAETPAGRYLLNVDVAANNGGGVGFLKLPENVSFQDFTTLISGGATGSPMAESGTP